MCGGCRWRSRRDLGGGMQLVEFNRVQRRSQFVERQFIAVHDDYPGDL
jgi:hypothetical protein